MHGLCIVLTVNGLVLVAVAVSLELGRGAPRLWAGAAYGICLGTRVLRSRAEVDTKPEIGTVCAASVGPLRLNPPPSQR